MSDCNCRTRNCPHTFSSTQTLGDITTPSTYLRSRSPSPPYNGSCNLGSRNTSPRRRYKKCRRRNKKSSRSRSSSISRNSSGSNSPRDSNSSCNLSSNNSSPNCSRSPSPKRRYRSKKSCRYVMLNASKALCHPRLRKRYANRILKIKTKRKNKRRIKRKKRC